MKHTKTQTRLRTLTDLYRALDHRHAVTITYLKAGETEPTIRTIEIQSLRTSSVHITQDGTVKGGDIIVTAMCRLRGEARDFHLSAIQSYTVHRIAYTLTPPANTTYAPTPPAPAHDATALVHFELERDRDDADYRPRRLLTQTDTDLAA